MTLTELLDLTQNGWVTVVDRDTELRTEPLSACSTSYSGQLKTLRDKKVVGIHVGVGMGMTVEVAS